MNYWTEIQKFPTIIIIIITIIIIIIIIRRLTKSLCLNDKYVRILIWITVHSNSIQSNYNQIQIQLKYHSSNSLNKQLPTSEKNKIRLLNIVVIVSRHRIIVWKWSQTLPKLYP